MPLSLGLTLGIARDFTCPQSHFCTRDSRDLDFIACPIAPEIAPKSAPAPAPAPYIKAGTKSIQAFHDMKMPAVIRAPAADPTILPSAADRVKTIMMQTDRNMRPPFAKAEAGGSLMLNDAIASMWLPTKRLAKDVRLQFLVFSPTSDFHHPSVRTCRLEKSANPGPFAPIRTPHRAS